MCDLHERVPGYEEHSDELAACNKVSFFSSLIEKGPAIPSTAVLSTKMEGARSTKKSPFFVNGLIRATGESENVA
jgi:hypothetical protein